MEEKIFSIDICDFKGQTYKTSFIKVGKLVYSIYSVLPKLADEETQNLVKPVGFIDC